MIVRIAKPSMRYAVTSHFDAACAFSAGLPDLLARVAKGPMTWRLVATIARPGDPNRAAEVWPEDREKVDLGELVIDHVESEASGNCRDVNFDPLVLPAGMAASDDPIPYARSAVYAASFRRRTGEAKPPSAVANQKAEAPR